MLAGQYAMVGMHAIVSKRDDERFCYVAAWEWGGEGREPVLHKERLEFENVHLATRSYK